MQILMGCCPAAKTSGLVSRRFSTVLNCFLISTPCCFLNLYFFFQISAFPTVWFSSFSSLSYSWSSLLSLSVLLFLFYLFPLFCSSCEEVTGNSSPLQLLRSAGISFTGGWFEGRVGGLHLRESEPQAPIPQLPLPSFLWHFSFLQSPAIIKNDASDPG